MLVTFTTEAYADITMFGEIASTLLKMMGHSASIPGAILAADVPAALSQLSSAVNSEKGTAPTPHPESDDAPVTLSNRALPLIALLTAAAKARADVMWK